MAQLADELADQLPPGDVDPRRRLVEEHHLGLADERERERQALLLAARHPSPRRRAPMAEADTFEQRVGILGVVVVRREQPQRLTRMDAGIHAAGLQHGADPADERRVVGDRIEAEHAHVSGRRPAKSLERLDRGGLARTVGPEEREHLTGPDGERHVVDGSEAAVADDELVHVDHAHRSTLVGRFRPGNSPEAVDTRQVRFRDARHTAHSG